MRVYQYQDYRAFMTDRIKSLPKAGRGELLRIARFAGIHTTNLSQALRGTKQLSLDQACLVADYFGLSDHETRYFLLLAQQDRAATPRLKQVIQVQLDELKKDANELVNVLRKDKDLSEYEKAV